MRRLLAAAALLAACVTAPTIFEATSLRPEAQDRHYKTVAVVFLTNDPSLRKLFGDGLVGYLRPWTQRSERGADLLPRALYDADGDGRIDANIDRDLIRKRLRDAGFDAIITGSTLAKEEAGHGGHRWHEDPISQHFAEAYEASGQGMPPEFLIETSLFDAESGRVMWSGHSRTLQADNAVTLSQSYAAAVVDELVKRDLLRKR